MGWKRGSAGALDPPPDLPENFQYRDEALFEMAHAIGSLPIVQSESQARQSSSCEPGPPEIPVAADAEIRVAAVALYQSPSGARYRG